jgi:hypothetical protein
MRPNAQTIKASNPAKKKPPSNIDQSPVSNPSSRPSAVERSTVECNIVDAFCPSTNFDLSTSNAFWLLQASNTGRQSLLTRIASAGYFNDLICGPKTSVGMALPTHSCQTPL